MKRGDLLPIAFSTLSDSTGAVDLTGASVQFIMRARDGTMKVNAAATIDDAAAGLVSYVWTLGDTDTPGVYPQEWEVTFPDGKIATFPNAGYNYVTVARDLADTV